MGESLNQYCHNSFGDQLNLCPAGGLIHPQLTTGHVTAGLLV
jgi:hypothetical protein